MANPCFPCPLPTDSPPASAAWFPASYPAGLRCQSRTEPLTANPCFPALSLFLWLRTDPVLRYPSPLRRPAQLRLVLLLLPPLVLTQRLRKVPGLLLQVVFSSSRISFSISTEVPWGTAQITKRHCTNRSIVVAKECELKGALAWRDFLLGSLDRCVLRKQLGIKFEPLD